MTTPTITTATIEAAADAIIETYFPRGLPSGCTYTDIVKSWVLLNASTSNLMAYIDSLPTWDSGYSMEVMDILAARAELDADSYRGCEDMWYDIKDALSAS